jgi:transcription antitermination factor NusG
MIQSTDTLEAQAGPWFVIWAESRAEKKVEKRIAALGLSPWLPIVRERHRWSDRWREVECPLFRGYLFARAATADWHRILRTPGVLTVITERGRLALLADSFVASLRDAINRKVRHPKLLARALTMHRATK